ncbi:MAG TPA: hypothetical protein VFP85_02315 [Vicinamibacterales bacterium]|jgi:hypothetical protein|nr:hypothetical protein [Vicinamibacterales bacterium]
MRIGGGVEKWMVVLPAIGLAVMVTVYMGGPDNAFGTLERMAWDGWNHLVLLFRR